MDFWPFFRKFTLFFKFWGKIQLETILGGWVRVAGSSENKANLAQLGLELGLSNYFLSLQPELSLELRLRIRLAG